MEDFDNNLFAFDDDDGGENGNGEQPDYLNQQGSYRDSTLFLVDCSASMFAISDEGGADDDVESMTFFQKCMKAILNMYQAKIYGSDRDLLGIVFFGTKTNNTGEDFANIHMLQDLDQPSAERIKQIEKFITSFSMKSFQKEYGHSDSFSLDKVLWWCSNMFASSAKSLDTKRIMLFTNTENPHQGNKKLEQLAKNKAKDLNDIGIMLELVPLIAKGQQFDYTKFYGDILMLSDEEIKALPDPAETFEELERTVRSKDHKKRPYTHLQFSVGDLKIACSIYNMIRKCPKPSKVKLDKKTNVETKTVSRPYNSETGEILLASDIKYAVDVCEKRVSFEQDEIKVIRRFGSTGLKLLGFKSMSCLKPHYYVKPGHFLYPDEKEIQGSSTLFGALLKKCLEKKRFILCEMVVRVNSAPRMVALVPQEEELDSHRIQTSPPGFHVFYLPYADDVRQIDKQIVAKPTEENITLFRKSINKLKFTYNPEDFKNPAIQKMWSEIEAVALEREKPEEIIDLTKPNNERLEKRAGEILQAIQANLGMSSDSSKTKRKAEPSNGAAKKLKTNENEGPLDVAQEAKAGRLEKLTVAVLKEFMKEKKISQAYGTKKDDLIKAIKEHLSV